MFAMFFGAGNIIFPLGIGHYAQDHHIMATLGLLVTAVLMPFAGVFAMILFDGNYRDFFNRIGRIPGFLLALLLITLLGPVGSTPRCIALTYSTLRTSLPEFSPIWFDAASCALLFLLTMQKQRILGILGKVLTPLFLVSLGSIVILGLLTPPNIQKTDHANLSMFMHGFNEGYKMMDLMAAFFFSSTILSLLKTRHADNNFCYIRLTTKASFIGAGLLALVYIGFSTIAAFHGAGLDIAGEEELLSAITLKLAGPYANALVGLTVALACLTTAMALISVFADFVQKEVFNERISYVVVLFGALLVTFAISTLQFTGISAFLGPILMVCYPGLIVLTLLNIAYKLYGFEPVKTPVFLTFLVTAVFVS